MHYLHLLQFVMLTCSARKDCISRNITNVELSEVTVRMWKDYRGRKYTIITQCSFTYDERYKKHKIPQVTREDNSV